MYLYRNLPQLHLTFQHTGEKSRARRGKKSRSEKNIQKKCDKKNQSEKGFFFNLPATSESDAERWADEQGLGWFLRGGRRLFFGEFWGFLFWFWFFPVGSAGGRRAFPEESGTTVLLEPGSASAGISPRTDLVAENTSLRPGRGAGRRVWLFPYIYIYVYTHLCVCVYIYEIWLGFFFFFWFGFCRKRANCLFFFFFNRKGDKKKKKSQILGASRFLLPRKGRFESATIAVQKKKKKGIL